MVPSLALKYTAPPEVVSTVGFELPLAAGLMFATSTVPPLVPSVFQSSTPFAVESVAAKNNCEPSAAKFAGLESVVPGKMSFTNTVPPAVPSLFQSSAPAEEVRALK